MLACAVIMFWIARNLIDSRMGRAMMAIRDQPLAADTMGIDTARYKTITFGISAAYTGIAGALSASAIASAAAVPSSSSEALATSRPVRSQTMVWKLNSASSRP